LPRPCHKGHMKHLLALFLLALIACTKSPDLLEQTELPESAFVWSSISISAKGIKQNSSLNPQNISISLPTVHLRLGQSKASKYKAILSVSSSGTPTIGTAEIAYLDGISKEVLLLDRDKGIYARYTGAVSSLGQSFKLPILTHINRPCLEVRFTVQTSNGAEFKRLSTDPICPGVTPIDLSIKLKTPIQRLYNATQQQITLRLERPFSIENPLGQERLSVTIPNVQNLELLNRTSAQCSTQQNTVTCVGDLRNLTNNPSTLDIPVQFDPTSTDPITITASYTSQAVETALGNNTITTTLPVLEPPNADLSVQWNIPSQIITDTTTPISITVQNHGTATSTTRKLTATLGNGAVLSTPTNCGLSIGGSTFNCVIPPIAPNGTHTLTWTTSHAYTQTLYLETTVYGNNTDFDVYFNNSASIQSEVIHDPATVTDLSITLNATPDPPQSATGQQYTLTIQNTAQNPANTVAVQFSSSAGVQFTTPDCTYSSSQCSLGTLAAGASRVITFTSTTLPNQAYETVQAHITTSSPESDPNNNNASISATFPGPDMAVALSSSPEPVTQAAGQQHILTIQNIGVVAGSANLEILAGDHPLFTITNSNCVWDANGLRYVCNFASLEPGQLETITLTRIAALTDSGFSLFATVYTSMDTDGGNNTLYESWQFEP
jgi:hypothetical protein